MNAFPAKSPGSRDVVIKKDDIDNQNGYRTESSHSDDDGDKNGPAYERDDGDVLEKAKTILFS